MNEKTLRKRFDLYTASTAFVVAYFVLLLFQVIVSLFPFSDVAKNWVIIIGNQLIFFLVPLIISIKKEIDFVDVLGIKRPPKAYLFPLFILAAIGCLVFSAPLAGMFSRWLTRIGYSYKPNYFVPLDNPGLFSLAFLGLTLFPVLGEEVLFRGVVLSGGKQRSPFFAILFSSLLFALMHGNLRQLAHQLVLALVMGYLAYLTRGIYACALVHIINNGAALLLDYGYQNKWIGDTFYGYFNGQGSPIALSLGIVIGFLVLVFSLFFTTWIIKRNREKEESYENSSKGFFRCINKKLLYLAQEEASESQPDKLSYFLAGVAIGLVTLVLVLGIVFEVVA